MKQSLILLVLISITVLHSCGQSTKPKSNQERNNAKSNSIKLDEVSSQVKPFDAARYVHTEADYTKASGKGIIIQNSYPRGGGSLSTPSGASYGHAVFWSRTINKTEGPLVLNVHFSADSFLVLPSPTIHFKLLVPPDTMTPEKVSVFSFGLENIQRFVDHNFYQVSELRRTIPSNENAMFYVILLSHLATNDRGIKRAGLFLEGQELFYKLSLNAQQIRRLGSGTAAVVAKRFIRWYISPRGQLQGHVLT
ncbi:MAG: hypothetical protein AAGG68_00650 [Bacteroidota bacterium]